MLHIILIILGIILFMGVFSSVLVFLLWGFLFFLTIFFMDKGMTLFHTGNEIEGLLLMGITGIIFFSMVQHRTQRICRLAPRE